MLTVQTSQLKELMTLASNVRDRSGRLLATKGMVLTQQHFLVFKTWGIKEVEIVESKDASVKTDNTPSDENINHEKLNTLIEREKPRFSLNPLDHPLISELIRLSALRRLNNE